MQYIILFLAIGKSAYMLLSLMKIQLQTQVTPLMHFIIFPDLKENFKA